MRFTATDEALRPMGRATCGVTGMKFRDGDHLLAMSVVRDGEDPDVFVVFENGLAKRTARLGVPASRAAAASASRSAKISERGGDLVGALTVDEDDEVMVVMEKGKIVRSRVDEVHRTGRNTMGVQFAKPDKGDAIVARGPQRREGRRGRGRGARRRRRRDRPRSTRRLRCVRPRRGRRRGAGAGRRRRTSPRRRPPGRRADGAPEAAPVR